jgi:hypothetical protein
MQKHRVVDPETGTPVENDILEQLREHPRVTTLKKYRGSVQLQVTLERGTAPVIELQLRSHLLVTEFQMNPVLQRHTVLLRAPLLF